VDVPLCNSVLSVVQGFFQAIENQNLEPQRAQSYTEEMPQRGSGSQKKIELSYYLEKQTTAAGPVRPQSVPAAVWKLRAASLAPAVSTD
jgi:hypothetical protein